MDVVEYTGAPHPFVVICCKWLHIAGLFYNRLKDRGYDRNFLNQQFGKISDNSRSDLRSFPVHFSPLQEGSGVEADTQGKDKARVPLALKGVPKSLHNKFKSIFREEMIKATQCLLFYEVSYRQYSS